MSRLRELREAKGLTQEQLARLAGLTHTGYRLIENEQVDPKLSSVLAICAALGCTAEEAFSPKPAPISTNTV